MPNTWNTPISKILIFGCFDEPVKGGHLDMQRMQTQIECPWLWYEPMKHSSRLRHLCRSSTTDITLAISYSNKIIVNVFVENNSHSIKEVKTTYEFSKIWPNCTDFSIYKTWMTHKFDWNTTLTKWNQAVFQCLDLSKQF